MTNTSEQHQLSDYELLRLERIRRNNERLKQLGLDKKFLSPAAVSRKSPKKKKTPKRVTPSPRAEPGKERRSKRLSPGGDSGKLIQLSNAFDDEHYEEQGTASPSKSNCTEEYDYEPEVSFRQVKRAVKLKRQDFALSEVERKSFEGMDDAYVLKFEEFLRYENKISDQNARSVMRQVRKLASGEGIRYESPRYGWPEGCYFMKGKKVTPMDDFVQLMEDAAECEYQWGRDHGNGWLLSHPLKKLLLFQQFCLKNPSFLGAKCKIKEYCEGGFDEDEVEDTDEVNEGETMEEEDAEDAIKKEIMEEEAKIAPDEQAVVAKASKRPARRTKKIETEKKKNVVKKKTIAKAVVKKKTVPATLVENALCSYKDLVGHRRVRRSTAYEVRVKWYNDTYTWEPFSNIFEDDPVALATYAAKKNLLDKPEWKDLLHYVP